MNIELLLHHENDCKLVNFVIHCYSAKWKDMRSVDLSEIWCKKQQEREGDPAAGASKAGSTCRSEEDRSRAAFRCSLFLQEKA